MYNISRDSNSLLGMDTFSLLFHIFYIRFTLKSYVSIHMCWFNLKRGGQTIRVARLVWIEYSSIHDLIKYDDDNNNDDTVKKQKQLKY